MERVIVFSAASLNDFNPAILIHSASPGFIKGKSIV